MFDELRREDVVAGRNGGVRGKACAGRYGLACGGEIQVVFFHLQADALEAAECGVAFVHMANRRRLAQGAERADTADPQHHFLPDAGVVVAPV